MSSSPESSLDEPLSHKTSMMGLKLWVVIGLALVFSIVLILAFLTSMYIMIQNRRRVKKDTVISEKYRLPILNIPHVSKEIMVVGDQEIKVNSKEGRTINGHGSKSNSRFLDQLVFYGGRRQKKDISCDEDESRISKEKSTMVSSSIRSCANHDHSPLMGLPDQFSHLEWGHWFTLRELQLATHFFSDNHIIGDGGYGIVYKGDLINGTQVAIKKLHNHLGQAEKEFRVEVDAIGHVRHKNLVRLLGFCIEGTQRMLIYEYVKNGNLEQWLHGEARSLGFLDWEKRMKILLGTAKALAYLHEAIEPKVVHRDIKSSNILIDDDFNAKVSDFGLAKLLGPENPHITTRVMGTFGYVAPEYAKTGFLNEKSDIYSFGVVLLETITGRNPVDYGRAAHEINLVEWLKTMISSKRSEEVIDPRFEIRPSTKALKRALLIALRCLDPDYSKRPKMSQVVQMMESDDDHQMTSRNDRSHAQSKNSNNINAPISEYVVGRSN